jgi:hypothetical protein
MYQKDKMTLGFILPTARLSKNPIMENQLDLSIIGDPAGVKQQLHELIE